MLKEKNWLMTAILKICSIVCAGIGLVCLSPVRVKNVEMQTADVYSRCLFSRRWIRQRFINIIITESVVVCFPACGISGTQWFSVIATSVMAWAHPWPKNSYIWQKQPKKYIYIYMVYRNNQRNIIYIYIYIYIWYIWVKAIHSWYGFRFSLSSLIWLSLPLFPSFDYPSLSFLPLNNPPSLSFLWLSLPLFLSFDYPSLSFLPLTIPPLLTSFE